VKSRTTGLLNGDTFEVVSADSLDRELQTVRAAAAGDIAGVFGPGSVTWRVDREAANFLGAGRALLLQLAHPWVTAAIEQHSDTFEHPIKRFHRTFRLVFTLVFGTLEQSLDAARRLHHRHSLINGTLRVRAGPYAAGSRYDANGVPALRWVYATLVDTSRMCHDLVRRRSREESANGSIRRANYLPACLAFRLPACLGIGPTFAATFRPRLNRMC
jgi:uncharacterized protein (DUF2236 family)